MMGAVIAGTLGHPAWHNAIIHIVYLEGLLGMLQTTEVACTTYTDSHNLPGPAPVAFPMLTKHRGSLTWHQHQSKTAL